MNKQGKKMNGLKKKRKDLERHEGIYVQEGFFKDLPNPRKTPQPWSVSENIKFMVYMMLNREFFESK